MVSANASFKVVDLRNIVQTIVHHVASIRSLEVSPALALIMHPIGPVKRTNFYNMVLILFSIILAASAVAISMIHYSFGILAGSGIAKENFSSVREHAEQSRVGRQTTQFLVVVLPDGKVVNPLATDRF